MRKQRLLVRNGRLDMKKLNAKTWTIILTAAIFFIFFLQSVLLSLYCLSEGQKYPATVTFFERTDFNNPARWLEYVPSRTPGPNYNVAYQFTDSEGKLHSDKITTRFDFSDNSYLAKYNPGNTINVKYLPFANKSCWFNDNPTVKGNVQFWPVVIAAIILGLGFYFFFRNRPNVNQ